MAAMNAFGYDKRQIIGTIDEDLLCSICSNLLRDPFECTKCGVMFCKLCIDELLRYKKECPNKCKIAQDAIIRPASRIVWKLIRKHEIRCIFCDEKFRIEFIDEHQRHCQTFKCTNPLCRKLIGKKRCKVAGVMGYMCSEHCAFVAMYQGQLNGKENNEPLSAFYQVIKKIKLGLDDQGMSVCAVENMRDVTISENCIANNFSLSPLYGMNEFVWDTENSHSLVTISAEKRVALLNDPEFRYRNIFGSKGFMGGSQYWEIIIDSRTQHELKIGVSKTNAKNTSCAFSDLPTGYAYYGLGELRNGGNTTSIKYGKKFRKTGIVGVYLSMDSGTLSFSLNGECFGPAFKDEELKQGPVYPAVALLRVSGVILVTGKPVPSYFKH
eukprot:TRINITY_DN14011_c0_g1_i3.p1 TRINITY_DN14011_c0_g1~~TRINITY_DN14011_c0_g1_i3.p1  ORF type:complete len:382 (+),score=74.46 TRINITY_DN14011_c0_g1_i3:120-1265(+)